MAAAAVWGRAMGLLQGAGRQLLSLVPRGNGLVRNYYVDWRMLRDVKRRKLAFEYADERRRLNAIRKNTILPKELQEVADQEIAALPRDSCPVRIRNRCVLTSRPRGVKRKWRLSRIVFRHLADHNQMSGIQRAMW
ncbi:28S ribosomal protein S14, mitochondrial [Pristis pectinata]|uniref:28S ribosomal protein S14, mitochondrial n=1 Tax=Pristis pectinata TaxID=685728 RepID=UPI00223CF05F|nr:28S ribosomal protein S14, mitochondrial [Pristis pectinata]